MSLYYVIFKNGETTYLIFFLPRKFRTFLKIIQNFAVTFYLNVIFDSWFIGIEPHWLSKAELATEENYFRIDSAWKIIRI